MRSSLCVLLGLCCAVLKAPFSTAVPDGCIYEVKNGDKLFVFPGEKLCSLDKRFTAYIQSDGNFVVRSEASKEIIWKAGTSGQDLYLFLTYPGDLVLLDGQQKRQWTAGDLSGGERVSLHGDGSLLMYDSYGDVLWSSMAEENNTWCRSMLWENMPLYSGESLCSANLQYKAVMREDGNLAIYKMHPYRHVLWSTAAEEGPDRRLMLQINGELTIRDGNLELQWSSNASGTARYLVLQDDGNLVVAGRRGQVVWASGTAQTVIN